MLFDTLKREFCPPLDTSLLAALVADIVTDSNGRSRSPSSDEVNGLRATLKELASQADDAQIFNDFSDLHLTDDATTCVSQETPDLYHEHTGTSCTTTSPCDSVSDGSSSSDSSNGDLQPFSTPLGFLQAALPNVRTKTLKKGLKEAERKRVEGDMDIWDVVSGILSKESIRELEERGFDALEEQDALLAAQLQEEDIAWEDVDKGKSTAASGHQKKKQTKRPTKIALNDIRQQHHVRHISIKSSYATSRPAPDPWTQLSSLSAHLSTLLPSHSANYFQSYFHDPKHATPYDSLCAALSALPSSINEPDEPTLSDEHTALLFNLLDILFAEYDDLDTEQRSRLASDAGLALKATQGRGEDALDLTKLLRELDTDTRGYNDMGVYHQPVSPITARPHRNANLPSMPPPIPEPPQRNKSRSPPSEQKQKSKPPPNAWQSVPTKKLPPGPSPHVNYIPAYNRNGRGVNGKKTGKGGKADAVPGAEYMKKRDELLREATKMWQKGNKKTRGGEVAFYFAERAREFQEMAMKEKLNAAKAMVESRRLETPKQDTVDLHGTTVSEAIVIVKDTLREFNSSQVNPLKIITGRGSHSVNQISVLKPAVKRALVEDGWNVGSWDGGLVVRGKR